jgi:hypothetical protein
MAETLLQYRKLVRAPDGRKYTARACGRAMPGGPWQAWIEFVPTAGGPPIRTTRETTQPNRVDTVYWATGLSLVYLEGALHRALSRPVDIWGLPSPRAVCSEPAVLNPFSVYQKGEALLSSRLSVLSTWHLVNIAVRYGLTALDRAVLHRLPAPRLVEMIVLGVRDKTQIAHDSIL